MRCSYDPTCLYVSQGVALSPFGCGERHPLPVVLAPCSAVSSCNLCDELGEAFTDDSNAGRKVTHSSLPISRPLDLLLTHLQSMPLLPVSTSGAKLWVEIDGRAQDKVKRYAVASGCCCCCCCCCDFDVEVRSPWKSFASLMHDRSTYICWSAHACRARPGQCVHTAISRHAVEVCVDMPRPQASDARAHTRNRYFTEN
jgi:hypothetical protein